MLKTMNFRKFILLLVLSVSFLYGCSKETIVERIEVEGGSQILRGNGTPQDTEGKVGDWYVDLSTTIIYGPKTDKGWDKQKGISLRGKRGKSTLILSGNSEPSDEIGNDGDYYIDRSNQNLYGPKMNGKWGNSSITLRGENGRGNKILSGSSAPSDTQGDDGDYYIDVTNNKMYGPKKAGVWGQPVVNLKGQRGESAKILHGSSMPTDADGVDGDYYIDLSEYKFYGPKANGKWNQGITLKARGNKIIVGNSAPNNETDGIVGDWFIDTVGKALYGPKQEEGWFNPVKEFTGTVHTAEGAPEDELGSDGDYYIDTKNNKAYGPKKDGEWDTYFLNMSDVAGRIPKFITDDKAPVDEFGDDGDIFLDTKTYNIYGPKKNNKWGNPTGNIKGAKGDNGTSGSRILSGEGVPSQSLGNNGDWYVDKQNKKIYGPKTSSSWGEGIAL